MFHPSHSELHVCVPESSFIAQVWVLLSQVSPVSLMLLPQIGFGFPTIVLFVHWLLQYVQFDPTAALQESVLSAPMSHSSFPVTILSPQDSVVVQVFHPSHSELHVCVPAYPLIVQASVLPSQVSPVSRIVLLHIESADP